MSKQMNAYDLSAVDMAVYQLCAELRAMSKSDPSAAIRLAGEAIGSVRSTQIEICSAYDRHCREMFDKLWRASPPEPTP